MVCTEDVCCDERDHGYQKAGAHEMVVYYLAGYVHKKITITVTCEECCALLTASPDQFNSEETQLNQRRLTELRSFKPGCLREASFRLYALIKEVEEVVHDTLETSAVFGDIFWMAKAAAELKFAVEAKLDKKLLGMVCTEDVCCDERDHGYQKAGAHEMVVYYLAGYVHKKITKTVTCEECCALLTASPDQFNSEETQLNQRRLTELRSFKPGCLREASFRLYASIKEVEEVVHDTLETSAVFGDIFWMVLDRFHATALPAIGSNEHHEFLTTKIIKCYCLMRMHFFSRKKNRELLVTEKVQNARKKAKLL
ncbi:hypothetical protein MRX96_000218 [Rhipicephalus microplus]